MKKAFLLVLILFVSVLSTACINNLAVQQLNNKAKDYLNSGDYENAISRLKSSIDLDSTIFETHYNLGIAYTQAGKYPEAVDTFQNAIKLKPSFADTYYSLAVAEENFAKGIIDGTLEEKTDNPNKFESKKSSDNDEEQSEPEDTHKNPKLTTVQRAQVAKLLTDSYNSYKSYLDKSENATDKDEVEQKLGYLQEQIAKYSDPSIQ